MQTVFRTKIKGSEEAEPVSRNALSWHQEMYKQVRLISIHWRNGPLEDGPLVVGNVEEHNTYDLSTVWPTKNGIRGMLGVLCSFSI